MVDPRIHLKNRALAGFLGFLVPGGGHLYQGRRFKAGIYFFCILGLFFTGMAMAEWKAVQPPGSRKDGAAGRGKTLKFLAQVSLGVPAITSLIQSRRLDASDEAATTTLEAPLTAHFKGSIEYQSENGLLLGPAEGTLTLAPATGRFGGQGIQGNFTGTLSDKPVEFKVGGGVQLGRPLDSDANRSVTGQLIAEEGDREVPLGRIEGSIPRPLLNHLLVPMTPEEEQDLHGRLGKRHELAMVLTWIAGLLNILAIWDAVEGPAYGYGDEEETPEVTGGTAPPPPADPEPAASTT